jgi:multiple sugar transport system ATP-binding protein
MVLGSDGGIPAVVHVVEPTGSETQVVAQIGDASVLCAFRERVSARPGETIRIAPDPMLAHLFDAETGRRQYAGSA